MRLPIVHPGAGDVSYEIRGIVDFAQHVAATGVPITWENIGDPVAKGEPMPEWIRRIVADEALNNPLAYAYSPTKGLSAPRAFIASYRTSETGVELSPERILFFNGLGDAISKIYACLHPDARVLVPQPAYPSHASLEAAHANSRTIGYSLDPDNNWLPDINEIRRTIETNPGVAGLLVINPDNPTGAVYPREMLKALVELAREYQLFLIADEIYANLTYEPDDFTSMAELAGDVPLMVMRGLSKEIPWPGSRCGWVEFYNADRDPDFARYARSIEEAKMTEVCSTTLPQAALPKILGDPRYLERVANRRRAYRIRADEAAAAFAGHPALKLVKPKGAFYLSVTFSEEFVHRNQLKPAANPEAQKLLEAELGAGVNHSFDKAFCYHLLAATGICTVPLSSGFSSRVQGFRMTLLEADNATFTRTLQAIKEFVSDAEENG